MESNDNKIKESNKIKRNWYEKSYILLFDDKVKNEGFGFDNILVDQKFWKYLVYNISYKTFIGPKPLRIRFNKGDGLVRVFNGTD